MPASSLHQQQQQQHYVAATQLVFNTWLATNAAGSAAAIKSTITPIIGVYKSLSVLYQTSVRCFTKFLMIYRHFGDGLKVGLKYSICI